MKTKEQKQKEALARQAERDSISARDQIRKLDHKYGSGLGAKKERAKLAAMPMPNVPASDIKGKLAVATLLSYVDPQKLLDEAFGHKP